jgi:hypothetical protein
MVWAFKQYAILSLTPPSNAIVGATDDLDLRRQENAPVLGYKFSFTVSGGEGGLGRKST